MTAKFLERLHYADPPEGAVQFDRRVISLRFAHIECGPFLVSVQAGEGLYSTPRKFATVLEYTEWEVAVFFAEGGGWVSPDVLDPFVPAAIMERFERGMVNSVAAYMPTEDVERLIDLLTTEGATIIEHRALGN